MGQTLARRTNRDWFVDQRSPGRRLQVTWHPDERVAVFSVWHGDTCASTFRLPLEDASRLISVLANEG
jgi:hypothetical protein